MTPQPQGRRAPPEIWHPQPTRSFEQAGQSTKVPTWFAEHLGHEEEDAKAAGEGRNPPAEARDEPKEPELTWRWMLGNAMKKIWEESTWIL